MALMATTLVIVVPTLAGALVVRGHVAARLAWGGLLGSASVLLGAYAGGFLGVVGPGAALGLASLVVLGRRRPLDVGARIGWVAVAVLLPVAIVAAAVPWLPELKWDAMAIWLMRARVLAEYGTHANPLEAPGGAPGLSNYPIGLSALHAIAYSVQGGGRDLSHVPVYAQAALLWGSGAVALTQIVHDRGIPAQALLATWAASPLLVLVSVWGHADVPGAILVVGGGTLLLVGREGWASLLLCAAATTKLEMVGFAVVLVLATRAWRIALPAVIAAIIPWFWFAQSRGLEGYLDEPGVMDASRVALLIPERSLPIVDALARMSTTSSSWAVLPLTIVFALAVGRDWRSSGPYLLAAAGAFGVLAAVYLVTPFDLEWHLSSSTHRVVMAPVGILVVAGIAALGAASSTAGAPPGGMADAGRGESCAKAMTERRR